MALAEHLPPAATANECGITRGERALVAAQRAWSYLHTLEVAERLRGFLPRDAAPLPGAATEPLGKSLRPHRVIVHKLNDPFSQRMRAALGLKEPSGV